MPCGLVRFCVIRFPVSSRPTAKEKCGTSGFTISICSDKIDRSNSRACLSTSMSMNACEIEKYEIVFENDSCLVSTNTCSGCVWLPCNIRARTLISSLHGVCTFDVSNCEKYRITSLPFVHESEYSDDIRFDDSKKRFSFQSRTARMWEIFIRQRQRCYTYGNRS